MFRPSFPRPSGKLLIPILAFLLPSVAFASVQATIFQPQSSALTGNTLKIKVQVASDSTVTGVKAKVEDRAADLTYDGDQQQWLGTLTLTGLAANTYILDVTATDAQTETSTAQVSFIKDAPPVIQVTEPADRGVAQPLLRLTATCTDDDVNGCQTLVVEDNQRQIAVGTSQIDTVASFEGYPPTLETLRIYGRDSRQQAVQIEREIDIEPRANLKQEATVHGRILDAQPDRILFMEMQPDSSTSYQIKIHNRQTSEETVIGTGSAALNFRTNVPFFPFGSLTTAGAIYTVQDPAKDNYSIYEWRNGSLTLLTDQNGKDLVVKENYAAWSVGLPNANTAVINRENLLTGTIQSFNTENSGGVVADVAANGDVLFVTVPASVIERWRTDSMEAITPFDHYYHVGARTDGINIVYAKYADTYIDNSQIRRLLLVTPNEQLELSAVPVTYDPTYPKPGRDYRLNNGWVAFTKPDDTGALQLWQRTPQGDLKRLTYATIADGLNALGPDGQIAYVSYPGLISVPYGQLHLIDSNGGNRIDLGSGVGQAVWQDDGWHVIYGNTLFTVTTTATPPPTCPGLGKGDVNADGKVSLGDVILALRMAVRLEAIPNDCAKQALDVNCDGEYTTTDATLILRNYVLGEAFPACSTG